MAEQIGPLAARRVNPLARESQDVLVALGQPTHPFPLSLGVLDLRDELREVVEIDSPAQRDVGGDREVQDQCVLLSGPGAFDQRPPWQVGPEVGLVKRYRDRELAIGPDVSIAILEACDRDHSETGAEPGRNVAGIRHQLAKLAVPSREGGRHRGAIVVERRGLAGLSADLDVDLANILEER
jgi:hypothetical protein